jgi:hypothetical protein
MILGGWEDMNGLQKENMQNSCKLLGGRAKGKKASLKS